MLRWITLLLSLSGLASALTLYPAHLTGTAPALAGTSSARWLVAYVADSLEATWEGKGGSSFDLVIPGRILGAVNALPVQVRREQRNASGSAEWHGAVGEVFGLAAGESAVLDLAFALDDTLALALASTGTCAQTVEAEVAQVRYFRDIKGELRSVQDGWQGSLSAGGALVLAYASLPITALPQGRTVSVRARCGAAAVWRAVPENERMDSARSSHASTDLGTLGVDWMAAAVPTVNVTGNAPVLAAPFAQANVGQALFQDESMTYAADATATWFTKLPVPGTSQQFNAYAVLPWEHGDGSVGFFADHWWNTATDRLLLQQGAADQAVDYNVPTAAEAQGRAVFRHSDEFSVLTVEVSYARLAQESGGAEFGRGRQPSATAFLSFPLRHAGTYRFGKDYPLHADLSIGNAPVPTLGEVWVRNASDAQLAPNAGLEATVGAQNSPLLYTVPTGRVTVLFASTRGARFRSPWLEVERVGAVGGLADEQAYQGVFRRELLDVDSGSVTAIVLPGRHRFRGFARVGESVVEFGRFEIDVRDGDKLVVSDPDAPVITLVSPSAAGGACIAGTATTIQGTVDGLGNSVDAVLLTVNGDTIPATLVAGAGPVWNFSADWLPDPAATTYELVLTATTETGAQAQLSRTLSKAASAATAIAFSAPASSPLTVPHAQSSYTLQGLVSAEPGAVPTINLGGKSVAVDPVANTWSVAVPLAAGNNTFQASAQGLCGVGPVASTTIVRPNETPAVTFDCSAFSRLFTGDNLALAATAVDPDGDAIVGQGWQFAGAAFATGTSAAYTVIGPGALAFCATDDLGGQGCGSCSLDPQFVVRGGCGRSSAICGTPNQAYEDGPEYRNYYVRHSADSLYFLIEVCSPNAFESDEYLNLDLVEGVGDNFGYDKRLVLDFYRPGEASARAMLVRSELWNAATGRWEYASVAYPQGQQPHFGINNTREPSPLLGDSLDAGHFVEIAIARPAMVASIGLSLDGSRYQLPSQLRYSLQGANHTQKVDGRSCDWTPAGCSALASEDPTDDPADWTLVNPQTGVTVVADNTESSGDGSSLAIYSSGGGSREISTVVTWGQIAHSTSVSYDLWLPADASWWLGTVRLEMKVLDCAPWYMDFGTQAIPSSHLDATWHRWSWSLDADAIAAQYAAGYSPLIDACKVQVQIGVNVVPSSNTVPFRLDNLQFVK
jgi:hypothetical protein